MCILGRIILIIKQHYLIAWQKKNHLKRSIRLLTCQQYIIRLRRSRRCTIRSSEHQTTLLDYTKKLGLNPSRPEVVQQEPLVHVLLRLIAPLGLAPGLLNRRHETLDRLLVSLETVGLPQRHRVRRRQLVTHVVAPLRRESLPTPLLLRHRHVLVAAVNHHD
jgi:hypothetical protein